MMIITYFIYCSYLFMFELGQSAAITIEVYMLAFHMAILFDIV